MSQFQDIDVEVLGKYSSPGPRYTSYPSAPLFSSAYGAEHYREEILRTNSSDEASPLSLYVHLPFCDTLCYFCGCTMVVTHSRERIAEYNQYLKKEIDLVAPLISPRRKVAQLHWGGGTPSYLSPSEIEDLGTYIVGRFAYDSDIEAGVEIDPRGLTYDHMKAFRDVGFNRVSMGVQDFDPRVQQAVNRIQSEEITREAVHWSRELGFKSINIDLIYGLPYQTLEWFEKTIDTIIDISPDRVAVFNYAYVPWLKPHQKIIPASTLPSPELKLRIFKRTIEQLVGAGYWNIGMDHFAKRSDELAIAQQNKTLYRNFQGYSTKAGCDLYGFGMSAIGHFRNTYHQNTKVLRDYYAALDRNSAATVAGYHMNEDDHIRKDVIMRIMCDMEVEKRPIEERYGIQFDEYFADALQKLNPLEEDRLVVTEPDRIMVNGVGRLVVRNIAMCFDAYIDEIMREKPIFSKTV